MTDWIKKKRINILFTLLGGLTGYLYWKFVGCTTGSCPIKSHWYSMVPYGMLLGWLIGDLILSFKKVKPKE